MPTHDIPDGELEGAGELVSALASTAAVQDCLARQWLRFVLARIDVERDDAAIAAISEALAGQSMREAFVAIVESEAFTVRTEKEDPRR